MPAPRRLCHVLTYTLLAMLLATTGLALAKASHRGWPHINGRLWINHNDANATIHGDLHKHNELLGGHRNDTIYAGDAGDVIWGDFKPSGQPASQFDRLHGGAGNDYIYASHGYNHIWTGTGDDHIFLVYGHGIVDCNGGGLKTLVMRKLPQNRHWDLRGCRHKRIIPYAA